LQGRRATPKMTEEKKQAALAAGKEIVEVSSSQMSIDSQLENFDKLIKLLVSISEYATNESELTFDGIRRNQPPIQTGRFPEIYQIQVITHLRLPVL
jgi:hypothetical protein